MTGRPGQRTMEMNGRRTVSYLVRTPRIPLFMLILIGLEAKGLLAFQGQRGIASVVPWNLRPVIFSVDFKSETTHWQLFTKVAFCRLVLLGGLRPVLLRPVCGTAILR